MKILTIFVMLFLIVSPVFAADGDTVWAEDVESYGSTNSYVTGGASANISLTKSMPPDTSPVYQGTYSMFLSNGTNFRTQYGVLPSYLTSGVYTYSFRLYPSSGLTSTQDSWTGFSEIAGNYIGWSSDSDICQLDHGCGNTDAYHLRGTTATCGTTVTLNEDTWNNISLVLDADNDKCHLYNNGVFKATVSLGTGSPTFKYLFQGHQEATANNWNMDELILCEGNHTTDGCWDVVSASVPSITSSTYNHSTAVNASEEIVWRTNQNTRSHTNDTTPTIRFDTDVTAWCRIGVTDSNWTTMGDTRNCATTNSTSHVCSVIAGDAFTAGSGTNYAYISCAYNADTTYQNATSTSGALNLTVDIIPSDPIVSFKENSAYQSSTLESYCSVSDGDSGDSLQVFYQLYQNGTLNVSGNINTTVQGNLSLYNHTTVSGAQYNLTCWVFDGDFYSGNSSVLSSSFLALPEATLCPNITSILWNANISRGSYSPKTKRYNESFVLPVNNSLCGYTYKLNNSAGFSLDYTFSTNHSSADRQMTLFVNGTMVNSTSSKVITVPASSVYYINWSANYTNLNVLAARPSITKVVSVSE